MESDAKFAGGLEPLTGGSVHGEGHSSGVSWGAVVGGAFATAAFSLILLALVLLGHKIRRFALRFKVSLKSIRRGYDCAACHGQRVNRDREPPRGGPQAGLRLQRMTVSPGCFVPMCWAVARPPSRVVLSVWWKQQQRKSAGGVVPSGRLARCSAVEKLSQVELAAETWRTSNKRSGGRPALMKWISMSTLSSKKIRRDNAAVLAIAGAPECRCAGWRSTGNYAARGEGGDPRGQESPAPPGGNESKMTDAGRGENGSAQPPGTP